MDDLIQTLTGRLMERLLIEVEASGRHVHLTREQAALLFGGDLTPERPLSQPGQYLCRERVRLTGPGGSLDRVAVLGPARREAQVEISLTDARLLGLTPPVRLSGSIEGTPGIMLEGPCGNLRLERGVIVAQRHIHLPPEQAALRGLKNGQEVRLKVLSQRPAILLGVTVRVSADFAPRAHLDFDEANACGFRSGDLGLILRE